MYSYITEGCLLGPIEEKSVFFSIKIKENKFKKRKVFLIDDVLPIDQCHNWNW